MDMGLHRMRWKIGLNHGEQENFQFCTGAAAAGGGAAVAAVTHDAFTLAFARFRSLTIQVLCSWLFARPAFGWCCCYSWQWWWWWWWCVLHTCKDNTHTHIRTIHTHRKAHLMRRVRAKRSCNGMAWHGWGVRVYRCDVYWMLVYVWLYRNLPHRFAFGRHCDSRKTPHIPFTPHTVTLFIQHTSWAEQSTARESTKQSRAERSGAEQGQVFSLLYQNVVFAVIWQLST